MRTCFFKKKQAMTNLSHVMNHLSFGTLHEPAVLKRLERFSEVSIRVTKSQWIGWRRGPQAGRRMDAWMDGRMRRKDDSAAACLPGVGACLPA